MDGSDSIRTTNGFGGHNGCLIVLPFYARTTDGLAYVLPVPAASTAFQVGEPSLFQYS
jgi:hypothetical protein